MKNVSIKRLPNGITEIKGEIGSAHFEAAINESKTGGIITFIMQDGYKKMEAIGSPMLGHLLEQINKSGNAHVEPESMQVVLNAIKPFIPQTENLNG